MLIQRLSVSLRSLCILLVLGNLSNLCAAESKPRMGIWDSPTPSAAPIAPAALAAKEGWTQFEPSGATTITGDAIISNGRYSAVFRKQSSSVELYSTSANGTPILRANLILMQGVSIPIGDANTINATDDFKSAAKLVDVVIRENEKGSVSVDAKYQAESGKAMWANFKLKKGDSVLEIGPGEVNRTVPETLAGRPDKLRIEAPSRFAVLPDFFSDDIVLDARKIKPASIEIPSENFLLQMVGKGDAIVMSVFESREKDAKLTLRGDGDERVFAASEINFGRLQEGQIADRKGSRIWVSVLEGPDIFHVADVAKSDAGKIIPLGWKITLPAIWRANFTRPNEMTDSWVMLMQEKKDGTFYKPSWLDSNEDTLDAKRTRWNTVLGTFPYPIWCDYDNQIFVQPLKNEKLSFVGPMLLYPIARLQKTPVDSYTVFDVIRNSMGVGPCEYILDLEGQKSEYKGRATCSTRDTLAGIYKKNQQKAQRAKVDKTLDEAMAFCTHIRGRITRYIEFGHATRAYLKDQKAAHPEWSASIDELDAIAAEIDARYEARKEKIRTLAYVAQLNTDFRKDVLNDDSPEALAKCKKYGKDLVEVGDNQDELSAECRWVVKSLRQRAGLIPASDPKAATLAAEIRKRTQDAMRNPAAHEGSQH